MLTERRIRDAIPGFRSRVLWDDQVTGLGVRITPAGTKSYVLDYRVHGRRHRVTLARTAESSLKGMRDRAGAELVQIRAGTGDPLTRRREAAAQSTVADGLDRFFTTFVPARRAAGRLAPRTEQTYRNQARRLLRPVLGRHRVADVTRRDIERMVAPLAPITRNRTLAFTSRLFTLFEHWDWRPHHTNPCRGVERAREEPRDRVLSPSDLAALGAALAAAGTHLSARRVCHPRRGVDGPAHRRSAGDALGGPGGRDGHGHPAPHEDRPAHAGAPPRGV